jgi:hypothetical protein
MTFLWTAVALHVTRQFVIGKLTERLNDQEAAKKAKGSAKEHSDRSHRFYNPSLEEIIASPVPFDANVGANGALKGGGKLGHRATAIGHDPIAGLVFGTANIATSTLTTWDMRSYHIKTGSNKKDTFAENAKTSLVLSKTKDKLFDKDMNQKIIVGYSLCKEIIHLKSDLFSKNSLPIPFVSLKSPQFASKLAEYGIDMGNVIKVSGQFAIAVFINCIIGMVHRCLYNEATDENERLYAVRTQKILATSNTIASGINIVGVAATVVGGALSENPDLVKKGINYIDVGGYIETIHQVVKSKMLQEQIRREYLEKELFHELEGDKYTFI